MAEPSSNELGLDPANESPFKGKTGLRRVWNALSYSLAGLKAAYLCEDAFRQEVMLAALLVPTAILLPVPWLGRGLMIASVLLVLVVELLNSAIEAVVDRVSLENHRLAKRAKDIGSAAVLVSLLMVMVIWGCVLMEMV
ncbi:diacylglycerol kinase [Dechloromonas sp. HYN0024]|uniref:diacylglycerol kinase n=1 Tax=Dechloromonas sp. HYN0024 TaxID=2231055 RepID=UPI000E437284|nr:diacylglycerol kinase [Dechloromonas sp. HYN0024]AXS80881.1 diacylglycerol kinase [Dechloromonas sp. HYN0024]